MSRHTNPREFSDVALRTLIAADKCPMCLGDLDTGWECNDCGFDASRFVEPCDRDTRATTLHRQTIADGA